VSVVGGGAGGYGPVTRRLACGRREGDYFITGEVQMTKWPLIIAQYSGLLLSYRWNPDLKEF
jgi:hypothetical protein